MFSTWNLDHVIERSRSVVPSLIEAVVQSDGRQVNVDYFHQLLVKIEKQLFNECNIISLNIILLDTFPKS